MQKAIFSGIAAATALMIVYFSVVSLISGWRFALEQFFLYWYFLIALAIGFGIQISLYNYLKFLLKNKMSPKLVATTGTTSTVAMISCCSHYLVNIIPFLAVGGFLTVLSQYQIQFFWLGIVFNLAGIAYLAFKVRTVTNHL